MKSYLYNSNVILSGASSGIGASMCKILIEKYNCNVLGLARNEEKLKKQKEILGQYSNNFNYFVMDVSRFEDWQKLYKFVKNQNYNIIINNAGTMHPFLKAEEMELSQIEKIFSTNFYSVIYSYKVFKDYLESKTNPAIINISSASSICSIPGESIYSSSKSALTTYSKILNSENKKIFVGTYLPGFTLTNLFFTKDNDKDIFDEESLKTIKYFCTNVDKMANKIINAIKNKKPYKIFGKDAKTLNLLNKIAPTKSSKFYAWLFKKVNLPCFEDINKQETHRKEL